ncbi:hypothetical protein [Aneurinibacillus terranovensis]|uniref:hypothetical protein n=1 Tax=Aneurinibacillus terranovensis TaxID=278991 RepID=UPI00138ABFC5|nr:hypothetical protein [Aneurinibacillus terranovensis]
MIQFYAKISDDLDFFYRRIQECNQFELLLLSKKEQIIKEKIQGISFNHEKELKDVVEALKKFKIQKDIWGRKIEALEAKLAEFTSDLPWQKNLENSC